MTELSVETQTSIFDISESKLHKSGILYVYAKYYKDNKTNYLPLLKNNIENVLKISNKYENKECIVYIDLKDLRLKDYDVNFIKILAETIQNDYPDSLGKMILVNVPFFIKTIYPIIKKFLDKDCQNKIFLENKKNNNIQYTNNINDFDD